MMSVRLKDPVLSTALACATFTASAANAAPSIGTSASVKGNVFVTTTDAGRMTAQVTKGALRFMSGNIGKANPTNASVETPTATIGIRGTFFEGVVGRDAIALASLAGVDTRGAEPEGASLVILRGPGKRRNTLDRTGAIVVSNPVGSRAINAPGYAVFVGSFDSVPSAPFKLTREMQDCLDFFLRSSPNGPAVNPTGDTRTGGDASGQSDIGSAVEGAYPLLDDVRDGITDENVVIEPEPEPEPPVIPDTTPIVPPSTP